MLLYCMLMCLYDVPIDMDTSVVSLAFPPKDKYKKLKINAHKIYREQRCFYSNIALITFLGLLMNTSFNFLLIVEYQGRS